MIVTRRDPAWRGLRVDYPTAVVDDEGRFPGGMTLADRAVVVTEVVEKSPAWEAGLRRGMLIAQVGGAPVGTPKEFAAAVARNAGPIQLRLAGDTSNPLRTVGPGS